MPCLRAAAALIGATALISAATTRRASLLSTRLSAPHCRGLAPELKSLAKFGGMDVFEARRLKQLEDENAQLNIAIKKKAKAPVFAI